MQRILNLPISNCAYRFTILLFLVLNLSIHAQSIPHNGEIYQNLISQYLSTHDVIYKSVGGRPIEKYLPSISLDSSSTAILQIGRPDLQYKKTDNKQYERYISLNLIHQEGSMQSEVVEYRDTLSGKDLRQVIRTSPALLKGDDPTTLSRWVKPITLISGSIAVVVALFYIRSS